MYQKQLAIKLCISAVKNSLEHGLPENESQFSPRQKHRFSLDRSGPYGERIF